MSTRARAALLALLGLIAVCLVSAQAVSSGQTDPSSLVERLRQFTRDNPTSPKLASVYSSLLSAAARESSPAVFLAIVDEAALKFPGMANDVSGAMIAFRRARGEAATKALAGKLLKTETNPQVLLSAAQAFPGSSLHLLRRAIALRQEMNSPKATPTLLDLRVAYAEALERAGRRVESDLLRSRIVEDARKGVVESASLANLYLTLADHSTHNRRYARALEYVDLAEHAAADNPLAFTIRYDEKRAAIYASMNRPDLQLECRVAVFANCMALSTRDSLRRLALLMGKAPDEFVERARSVRARSGRAVANFELDTPEGARLSLASLTAAHKVTILNFFFPT